MRATVDSGKCQGHQMCSIAAPDVFGSDEYGYAIVLVDRVPEALEAATRRAESNCPERAITLVEE